MQVGLGMAIKTRTNDFQPLDSVYRSFIDDAVMAEQLGFDFVTTSEHHFQDDAWSPSQLPILAHIAARTSRVRLQTGVLLLPLHDPLRVSEDAATVDILSQGRLDLVAGAGSVREEFETLGVDPKYRWGRLFEGMDLIRRSYSEDRFDYHGKHFHYPNVHQTTKPVQDPFPLWIGGFGPKLHYRSGKAGFHHQGFPRFHPEYLRGLDEAGLDPAEMNCSFFTTGHLASSAQKAWDECKGAWWDYQNEYRKRTWIAFGPEGPPPLAPLAEMPEVPDNFMAPMVGNPDDILTALEPLLKDSDCTHFGFAFRASGGGMPDEVVRPGIELFAREVLPVLRGWGRQPRTSVAKD
jgi:alkanesulfonate monooxygenase SsuD/methylene tetrahydromethanopterin reductase-like flavin-dependent oxidoreductase (luciferase family)